MSDIRLFFGMPIPKAAGTQSKQKPSAKNASKSSNSSRSGGGGGAKNQSAPKRPAAAAGWERFLPASDNKNQKKTANKRKADDDDEDYDVTKDDVAENEDEDISEAEDEDTMELDDFDKPSNVRIVNNKANSSKPAVQRQSSTAKKSNNEQPSKPVSRSTSTSGNGSGGVKKQSSFMAVAHPKTEIVVGGSQKRKTETPLVSSSAASSSSRFNQPAKKSRVVEEEDEEEVTLGSSRSKPKREATTTRKRGEDEEEEEFGSPVLVQTPPKRESPRLKTQLSFTRPSPSSTTSSPSITPKVSPVEKPRLRSQPSILDTITAVSTKTRQPSLKASGSLKSNDDDLLDMDLLEELQSSPPTKITRQSTVSKPAAKPSTPVATSSKAKPKPPSTTTTTTTFKAKPIVPVAKGSKAKAAKREEEDDYEEAQPEKKPKAKGFAWYQMQNRPDPPLKGQKELPVGQPNCLAGKIFHITGVLDSLEREQAVELIEEYGGQVTKTLAKKVTHAIVGIQPSEKKEGIIAERKLPVLNEDDLFTMIKTLPGKKLDASAKAAMRSPKKPVKAAVVRPAVVEPPKEESPRKAADSSRESSPFREPSPVKEPSPKKPSPKKPSPAKKKNLFPVHEKEEELPERPPPPVSLLWPDKWRPLTTKDIAGNPSALKRLRDWMGKWTSGEMPSPKAVLLSGPPGVGKSSAAAAICREYGYEIVEFNASDTRNKSKLDELVSTLIGNRTIGEFFAAKTKKVKKTCLIMDEVDGMSSGDRGGMSKLIELIKKTKIPIICICNDRSDPKIKTLKNYCEDIQFWRPTMLQSMPRLLGIASHEKLNIDETGLEMLFSSMNGDIRQMLNVLQSMSLKSQKHNASTIQDTVASTRKDIDLGPFEVLPKLLTQYTATDTSTKLNYYFVDTSLVPLLVQENYLGMKLTNYGGKIADLEHFAKAAELISDSDLIDKTLHTYNAWDLAPAHGMTSTVAPCYYASGALGFRINFPGWLSKYGPTQRHQRLLKELAIHMSPCISGNYTETRLDYLQPLKKLLVQPLQKEGASAIPRVLDIMNDYFLTRDDWDAIVELTTLVEGTEPKIDSKVKASFTRDYNRSNHAAHVALKTIKKGRAEPAPETRVTDEEGTLEEPSATEPEEEGEAENGDQASESLESDKMIKMKKPAASRSKAAAKSSAAPRKRAKK